MSAKKKSQTQPEPQPPQPQPPDEKAIRAAEARKLFLSKYKIGAKPA